jgi:hypothetical protein
VAEERREAMRAAPEEKIVLSSQDAGTPGYKDTQRRFQERVRELAERKKARETELLDDAMANWPCEQVFALHLRRLWRETMWLEKTGQFADGRPLNEQYGPEVGVIETFLSALVRREAQEYGAESEEGRQAEERMREAMGGGQEQGGAFPGEGSAAAAAVEEPQPDGQEWH